MKFIGKEAAAEQIMASGKSYAELSGRLGVSEKTISDTIEKPFQKHEHHCWQIFLAICRECGVKLYQ